LYSAYRSVAEPTKEMLVLEVWCVYVAVHSCTTTSTSFDDYAWYDIDSFSTGTAMKQRLVVVGSRDSEDWARKWK
jgi:hypothetical protein